MNREKLEQLAQSNVQAVREAAKQKLEELKDLNIVTKTNDYQKLIDEVNALVKKSGNKGDVDKSEVEQIVNSKLSQFEASFKTNAKSGVIEIRRDNAIIANIKNDKRKLFYVVLSDYMAENNVYLYGKAGTGKTFLAGEIAKAINYKLITLNCNQFTSPIDIIGGQTIDGYQEGRLSEAWANKNLGVNKNCQPYDGALLLLDELPKLDPNTAGLLNDALSKIKDPDAEGKDCATGENKLRTPAIMNGRGELLEKKNIFIIATGNSLLNEANKDYEANFKQDLSLQDRFAGSCYLVSYNYEFEYMLLSTFNRYDMTFAFNFLALLRQKINELNLTGIAFVSTRLMVSFRDTFNSYIKNRELGEKGNKEPKTLRQATMSFLTLFSQDQRDAIINGLGQSYDDFLNKALEKEKTPIEELKTATDSEKALAEFIIDEANKKQAAENILEL